MSIYRRIYEQHYGKIPKDSDGRSYEIHHIDGNHNNNKIDNLKAITIDEHFDVHYSQGDWGASRLIALRMKKTSEEISDLSRKQALQMVTEGRNSFTNVEKQKERGKKGNAVRSLKRSQGAYEELDRQNSIKISATWDKKLQEGYVDNNWFDSEQGKIMAAKNNGNANCPHCGKQGQYRAMKRWHFDNCKFK